MSVSTYSFDMPTTLAPKRMLLRELRHSHSYLLEVFLQLVCVDAHGYRRISVTEYLADCRNRHVLTK